MKGRYGWALLLLVIVSWDLAAALTNAETLTFTFRRAVAQTAWRWPALLLIILLVVHLFLPPRLQRYDPLDRLFQRIDPVDEPTRPPHPSPGPPDTGHDPQR
jgi:hypothetical protein